MRNVGLWQVLCVGLIGQALSATNASAATRVAVDLGTLGGPSSEATAINNVGDVIGMSDTATGAQHAFLLRHGTSKLVDLGTLPGDQYSRANAINSHGQIVGAGNLHGFFWDNGVITDLGALHPGEASNAFSINDLGQIVGFSFPTGRYPATHSVLWSGGKISQLGTLAPLGELPHDQATDINNRGQIVGSSGARFSNVEAFFLDHGKIADLGFSSSTAVINETGHVAGTSFLWNGSVLTNLGDFQASAINSSDQLAGILLTDNVYPAVWASGVATVLPGLTGRTSGFAEGINDGGDVVGYSPSSSGNNHAVIWRAAH